MRNYLNVEVALISFIAPRAIPRTSSGKIMRHKTKQMWQDGEFTVLNEFSREKDAGVSETGIEIKTSFDELKAKYNLTGKETYNLVEAGLDSLDLVVFMHELKELLKDKGAEMLARQVDIGVIHHQRQDERADFFHLGSDLCQAGHRASRRPLYLRADCRHAAPRRLPGRRKQIGCADGNIPHDLRRNRSAPWTESYHSTEGAQIFTGPDGQVDRILGVGANAGADLAAYALEPELVTALFQGQDRTKRQILTYDELPKVMVEAVLAIEDRRFFEHGGINWWSLVGSFVTDLRDTGIRRGGSTLTMQIARGFFLTPQKTITRKLTEMLIAIELEQKFNKQQLFELYANQVYLGQRGSFSINGFGEAARSYFGKDIKDITLPEAAMIAGIIQSPNLLNPYKRPEKVLERRNIVLDSMVETGAITREQCEAAKATPLKLSAPNVEASDAPYFVDMVKDTLAGDYSEADLNENAYRIYTTLDPDLQHAAAEAVAEGIKLVDEQVARQRTRRVRMGTGKNATLQETS